MVLGFERNPANFLDIHDIKHFATFEVIIFCLVVCIIDDEKEKDKRVEFCG